MQVRKVNLLDCTFRDGGYYNNWNFDKNLIQDYLINLSKTEIKNVEVGFLTIPKDKNKGITANCDNNFFKKVKIPKNINCGIMINASDIVSNDLSKNKIKTILNSINLKKIKFIRFACHIHEIPKIKNFIWPLKKKGFKIFINIMQISEIKKIEIKRICSYLNNVCDVIYIADSLGSLNKHSIKMILDTFKKYTCKPLGVHTHDNMSKALENSIQAYKCQATWIDGTIQGMGRGPGNVKMEDLVNYFYKKNSTTFDRVIKLSKKFLKLKKKYKWGTNKYYYLSGLYRIHPTYIQMLLSDKRYKKFKFYEVIKNLKILNARKYNTNTFYLAMNFYENKLKKFKTNSLKISFKKKVVIFGNGESLKNQDIINKSLIINSTKILINRSNYIKEKMVDIISCCHPIRLIADVHLLKNKKNNLLIPYETIPKIIQKKINSNNLINYNIKLGSKLKLGKNYIQMPKPLSLIYTLGFLISKGVKKIYLAGFDGFEQDDPFKDETQTYINDLKKLSKNLKIISLTKTKLKF